MRMNNIRTAVLKYGSSFLDCKCSRENFLAGIAKEPFDFAVRHYLVHCAIPLLQTFCGNSDGEFSFLSGLQI
jgi:hypothetical protein